MEVLVHARPARFLSCVGLTTLVAAAAAGCTAAGSGSAAGGGGSASASSPLDAVHLAAQTSSGATSFTGTMSLQTSLKQRAVAGAAGAGQTSMTASFAEQLRPSLVAEVTIGKLTSVGESLPGGLIEIVTPSTFYLKWSFLTQGMHLSKPWVAIPVSAESNRTGIDFSQLFRQASNNGPLTEAKLLAGATGVHQVGTGSINGVPVTEYTGQLSLSEGLKYFSGSAKTQLQQVLASAGITTATFTVWIDAQHIVRKSILVESGKTLTETTTTTITSIDQPVTVNPPPASQTAPLPSGLLSGSGSASGTGVG
jgi:hypothetical protein